MQPPESLPDKSLARRSFAAAAASYDGAAVLQQEIGRRLLERLDLVRLRPQRILDLGAGTGQCLPGLLRRYRGAEVVALDIALPMLQRARARGRWLRRPRCVCADAERLPFADARFDLVFSNLMLQWSLDIEAAFRELQRILRPGGLLLFTTFGPDTLHELRDSWGQADGYSHVNAFADMHDLGDALVRSRFADPVMDVERLTVTYPDLGKLMRELKQIGAHNVTAGRPRGLTGKGRLRRLESAYERYRRDGVLPASYEVVYGHAWATSCETSIPLESLRR
ncbi:MAG TPA: malonyl-[acyl-carrier protein] O-methyltransferase BioC [Gammaproteobacteria bacterium]|nr:malonyl-[acyl-carrier protein] O-methyltransferase BioC [Gammaproteobacteria bacterium]